MPLQTPSYVAPSPEILSLRMNAAEPQAAARVRMGRRTGEPLSIDMIHLDPVAPPGFSPAPMFPFPVAGGAGRGSPNQM